MAGYAASSTECNDSSLTVGCVGVVLMLPPPRTRFGWVASQGKEHLVEARLAEREVDEGDAGAGELADRRAARSGSGTRDREGRGVGLEVHWLTPSARVRTRSASPPIVGIAQPYVERARADRGLELAGVPSAMTLPWSMTAIRSAS